MVESSYRCAAGIQIRASDDYATGVKTTDPMNANLYVGTSSILAAAMGLAPSKDAFWSSSTEHYPLSLPESGAGTRNKGSPPRYPFAKEHYPEVQAAVAVLSCGPVGPSDAVGEANASLLARTCRSDGLLLKPR